MTPHTAAGVELARVVAVVAVFPDGGHQVGSGYLITGRLVLTAEHCTRDKTRADVPAKELRVIRASDAQLATGIRVVASSSRERGVDLAVLELEHAQWGEDLPAPAYARVNRSHSGMLQNCEAIGYPLFQYRPDTKERHTAELHGTIYQTESAASGRLVLRDPLLTTVTTPDNGNSPWGGLSGALVFHRGCAIGVVVEHHRRQGLASVQLAAFDQLLDESSVRDDGATAVAKALGLSPEAPLPVAQPVSCVSLDDLVKIKVDGDLPRVDALDPNRLGAIPSEYEDRTNYDDRDPFVPRTHHDVDDRLLTSLQPGQFPLLTGPSEPVARVGLMPTVADQYQDRGIDLDAVLGGSATSSATFVMSGMGGTGKTQLAAAYAHHLWDVNGGLQIS